MLLCPTICIEIVLLTVLGLIVTSFVAFLVIWQLWDHAVIEKADGVTYMPFLVFDGWMFNDAYVTYIKLVLFDQ